MPHRVLLVEDDRTSRGSLAQLLAMEGFEVVAFATAEEAQAYARTSDVDMAVLDLRLPGMWGDELALRLRQFRPPMQIVFVTGEFGAIDRLRDLLPNCPVFPKPLDLGQLTGHLHGLEGQANHGQAGP